MTYFILCILGILIFIILIEKYHFLNKNPPRNNLKKLYHKLSEEELKLRLSCLDINGKPTHPIKIKGEWGCKYYYNTTDEANPSVGDDYFKYVCEKEESQNDFFGNCKSVNETEIGCSVNVNSCQLGYITPEGTVASYSSYGSPQEGTISGFRIDHPFNSNSPIFMRINDIQTSPYYDTYNKTTLLSVEDIDECEEECAAPANTINGNHPIQGCYSYSYYTTNNGINNCSIHVSPNIYNYSLSFLKS